MIDKIEYYNLEGYVNYTLLKNVAEGNNYAFLPKKEISERSKKTFDIGHIFERYFLEDKDLSYIKVDKTEDLSGHSALLKDALLNYCRDNSILDAGTIENNIMLEIIKENKLWNNVKDENILLTNASKILEKINFLLSLQENDVIANIGVFDLISKAEEGLKKFPEVYHTLYPIDDVEIYTQLAIVDAKHFLLPVKGLPDRVYVDHKKKLITIIDFKTMENRVEDFKFKSFYPFKYYYQLPFYTRLFIENNRDIIDYQIEMKFVVFSKTTPEIPAVYILKNSWIDKAWEGWTSKTGFKIKGINNLLKEIKWYWELGGTSLSYLLAQNNNVLTIEEDWNE